MPALQLKYEHFTTGLIVSLLLHIFFGASLLQQKTPKATPNLVVEASLVEALSQLQKRQMVTPPEKVNKIEPKDAKLISDEDSTSPIQQIKRGDGENAGKIISQKPAQNSTQQSAIKNQEKKLEKQAPPTKQNQEKPAPKNKTLTTKLPPTKLDLRTDYQLLNELGRNKRTPNNNQVSSSPAQPFSRSAGSSAMFYGFSGSNDYLPNVQDGDITLLNAKADKFAVFVRRVAIRIFNLLKQYGWEYLRASEFI
jgi:hypothetical protein